MRVQQQALKVLVKVKTNTRERIDLAAAAAETAVANDQEAMVGGLQKVKVCW